MSIARAVTPPATSTAFDTASSRILESKPHLRQHASHTYVDLPRSASHHVSMAFKEGLLRAMEDAEVDQTRLADLLGISRPAVTQWVSGATTPKGKRLEQIASVLNTTTAALFTYEPALAGKRMVAVVAYVGAGETVYPFDDAPLGGGLELVPAPPGADEELAAVVVRGSSMVPVFWEGDLLFYTRDSGFDRSECLYQECIVKVLDGPTYVKHVMPGSTNSTFTLTSYNAAPLLDQEIEWAAPVRHVNRTRRRPKAALKVLVNPKKMAKGHQKD